MEANLKIVNQMLKEHGVSANKEAQQALINFSVLFGEKMVRKCTEVKLDANPITTDKIRQAYELSKGMRTVEYQAELEKRRKDAIEKVNSTKLIKEDEDEERGENTARSVVSVNFYNTDIYHMNLNKEHQLVFQCKQNNE